MSAFSLFRSYSFLFLLLFLLLLLLLLLSASPSLSLTPAASLARWNLLRLVTIFWKTKKAVVGLMLFLLHGSLYFEDTGKNHQGLLFINSPHILFKSSGWPCCWAGCCVLDLLKTSHVAPRVRLIIWLWLGVNTPLSTSLPCLWHSLPTKHLNSNRRCKFWTEQIHRNGFIKKTALVKQMTAVV